MLAVSRAILQPASGSALYGTLPLARSIRAQGIFFRAQAKRDPGHLVVMFLKRATPSAKEVGALQAAIHRPGDCWH